MQLEPACDIGGTALDGPRRPDDIDVGRCGQRNHGAVAAHVGRDPRMGPGAIGSGRQQRGGRGGRHLQWIEDPLPYGLLPACTADGLDHFASDQVHHVAVGEGAAETARRFEVAQAVHDLGPVPTAGRRIKEQVARAETESAAMQQQVAHGHLAARIRVLQLEAGQHVGNPGVPGELALVDLRSEHRARERLRRRTDRKQRVLVDLLRLPQAPHTVAAQHRRLAPLDDGDGHPRRLEGLEHVLRIGVEVGRRRRMHGRRNEHCGRSRCPDECAQPVACLVQHRFNPVSGVSSGCRACARAGPSTTTQQQRREGGHCRGHHEEVRGAESGPERAERAR